MIMQQKIIQIGTYLYGEIQQIAVIFLRFKNELNIDWFMNENF